MMEQFKDGRLKKRAESEVARAKAILKNNASKIDPQVDTLIKGKIRETQEALNSGDSTQVLLKTEELETAMNDNLSDLSEGKSKLRQNIESFLLAILLALLIREFIVQPFKIPSGSMIPTLLVGDHLLVTKFTYGTEIPFTDIKILPGTSEMKRGDVIVFVYPNYENEPSRKGIYYIKRIVGLPGDRIDIDGRSVSINGEKEPLEFIGDYTDDRTGEKYDEYKENLSGTKHQTIFRKGKEETEKGSYIPVDRVPEGFVFVMGDNRDNSQDSRFWGFVPIKNIAGKAFIVHWSWNLENGDILNKVRWNRILNIIH